MAIAGNDEESTGNMPSNEKTESSEDEILLFFLLKKNPLTSRPERGSGLKRADYEQTCTPTHKTKNYFDRGLSFLCLSFHTSKNEKTSESQSFSICK